jgi:Protein of unknown function (DUF1091)
MIFVFKLSMNSLEIKVKSININYMNPAYVSNYSVKQFIDSENNSRVFIWVVLKKAVVDIRISGVGRGKKLSSDTYMEFFKGAIDVCRLTSTFLGKIAQQFYVPLILQYGNVTIDCPIQAATLYMDFPLNEVKMPPFIPNIDADYILVGSFKTRNPKKRWISICDLNITGSVKKND